MTTLKINSAEFLAHYWQKKPLVIRQGFPNFTDFTDEHELAGLAMEEEIDSRIISFADNSWEVSCGPFDEFATVCQGQWTLLVQGLENYLPEAQAMMDEFDFIPGWRKDDVMMSYSVAGAGVGPHLDQYDVFIVQGKGSRRWQVGLPDDFEEITPHPKLRQISQFTPIIDEILYPGDIVYIPPGHPHNGVAQEECLNYSIGFRAANQIELLNSFCDHLLDNNWQGKRYTDPQLAVRALSCELRTNETEAFRNLLKQTIDSPEFENWLGTHLTDAPKFITEPPDEDYTPEQVHQLLANQVSFIKSPGVRHLHYQVNDSDKRLSTFINGDYYAWPVDDQKQVFLLLNSTVWLPDKKINFNFSSQFIHNLSTMLNKGLWIIQSD
ncbi:cupin domain-containing protein [Planctobacterium marinum]|uniref:cupin domain-containing protein n=1 Tax=Planctobacterium marinum TaxID=1631968 RepID=UPI001E2931D7|nr:cupin domain-containing protein [Planctobacterium marinum]MCC2604573.1 cupin domain-containing protein [Planctobacterium marinum]